MLKLIYRQILKHWKGLLPVLLVWIAGGYFLFHYRFAMLTPLVRWYAALPEPGSQKPLKAMPYLQKAEDVLKDDEVRLELMTKACQYYPPRITDQSMYKPHWLTKIREWNLVPEKERYRRTDVVEPDEYFQAHKPALLSALKHTLDASEYAFEITPEDRGEAKGETILVADRLSHIAEGLCRTDIARLIWGEYAEFLETRAYLKMSGHLQERDRHQAVLTFPQEKDIFILESLRNNENYTRALHEYAAGVPISFHLDSTCQDGQFRLVCVSLGETIRIYNKLLYFSPEKEAGFLHLRLGFLHFWKAEREGNILEEDHAMNHFAAASELQITEKMSRLGLARIHLKRKEIPAAYTQIKLLSLNMKNGGLFDKDFRETTRMVLIAAGRYQDADCFSPYSDTSYGVRPHCENMHL